jgi:pimeloyl-ACP methyl ester carboxylesterase
VDSVPLSGGGRIAYRRLVAGDSAGPPVLLLHGLGADHAGLIPLSAAWPEADVIAVDLPGFGRSDPLPEHSLDAYAVAVDGVCAALGLAEVVVVGHSFGADVGLVFAARHPDRVRKLVLISPVTRQVGLAGWLADTYYRIGCRLPARAMRSWFLGRASVVLMDVMSVSAGTSRHVLRRIIAEDFRTAALACPRAIPEVYRSVKDMPFASEAARLTMPTLLVGLERDGLAPPAAMRWLRGCIARGRLVVIPRRGHLWPVEAPAEAAALIARFLELPAEA